MSGTWLVSRPGYPGNIDEPYGDHVGAVLREVELRRTGAVHVVTWFRELMEESA